MKDFDEPSVCVHACVCACMHVCVCVCVCACVRRCVQEILLATQHIWYTTGLTCSHTCNAVHHTRLPVALQNH